MSFGNEDRMLKNIIRDNKKMGITQLKNLAYHLKIDISDIKCKGNYKKKLRKRLLENIK